VVITGAGLVPAIASVEPGAPVAWLNRTGTASIAISFESAFPGDADACEQRRAFSVVPGFGPFTTLVPPGAVVSLCAPAATGSRGGAPQRFRYSVHGDLSFEGALDVSPPP